MNTQMGIPVALPVVQPPLSSQELRGEVQRFATQANRLASQLIADQAPEPYTGHVVIRHHYHHYTPYYTPYYSPWFYPRPSIIVLGDRPAYRNRKEENEAANIALGVFATIGAMFATYAVGLAWARQSDAQNELDETREFQGKMAGAQGNVTAQDQRLVEDAQEAAGLKARICKRIRNSAVSDLALRISLAVGLIFVGAGAFAACPPLVGIGLVASMIASFAMVLKWGFDSTDQTNVRDARALQLKLLTLPA